MNEVIVSSHHNEVDSKEGKNGNIFHNVVSLGRLRRGTFDSLTAILMSIRCTKARRWHDTEKISLRVAVARAGHWECACAAKYRVHCESAHHRSRRRGWDLPRRLGDTASALWPRARASESTRPLSTGTGNFTLVASFLVFSNGEHGSRSSKIHRHSPGWVPLMLCNSAFPSEDKGARTTMTDWWWSDTAVCAIISRIRETCWRGSGSFVRDAKERTLHNGAQSVTRYNYPCYIVIVIQFISPNQFNLYETPRLSRLDLRPYARFRSRSYQLANVF